MKIAFLVWQFPVLSEPFILNQITGLIDRAHQVNIYACAVDQDKPASTTKIHPAVTKYNLLEHTYYAPKRPKNNLLRWLKGLALLFSNFPKNPSLCWQLFKLSFLSKQESSLKLLYRSIPFLNQGEYDIIHCQFGTLGMVGLSLRNAGIIKGKLITTFRGIDISSYVAEKGNRAYEPLFQAGNFFLANCEFFRQRAISIGCPETKIVVHGSGIDCKGFSWQSRHFPTDGKINIVTTGRLVEKKGIKYCIEAIAKLAETYPYLEYNIIGDGELKSEIQEQIQKLKVSHIVKLLGWKNQQEIIAILDKAHIFIATSITAADGNQDAPVNTLKEAMAMGLPVISTFHGGIPELVEDDISGFLVPEKNSEAIAAKINYLIQHPQSWEKVGKAARKQVEEKYDMEKLNDELVHIYQSLLSETISQPALVNKVVSAISVAS